MLEFEQNKTEELESLISKTQDGSRTTVAEISKIGNIDEQLKKNADKSEM